MVKTFLVGPCDGMLGEPDDFSRIRVVEASTEEEALDKYWADYDPTALDIENCCSMSVNDLFLAHLYCDDVGYMFDESTGEEREDILRAFQHDEEALQAYLRKNVEARVREFFADRPAYADTFMAAYDKSRCGSERMTFPGT